MRRVLAFTAVGAPEVEGSEHAAVVELVAADLAVPVVLHVGGVATHYEVRFNDVLVLTDSSMWARHRVDVSAHARVGDNRVHVRCLPIEPLLEEAPRRPRARWRTRLVDGRLRWVRTSFLGRMPGLPTGGVVEGPWRPMVLQSGEPVAVRSWSCRTRLDGDEGVLEVDVDVAGDLEGVVEGDTVEVEALGRVVRIVLDGAGRGSVVLRAPGVERWWPHTHGPPVLHEVVLRHAGAVLGRRRVGFRSLRNAEPGSVALVVNGVAVFCRGAVWTPGPLEALDTAVALGFNMVRVPGITTYEDEAFWTRCDELGVLVWQDLALANLDYPCADPGFAAVLRDEVSAEVGVLAQHPAAVVVCGSSELEQQAAMYGRSPADGAAAEAAALTGAVVRADGADVVWVDSSPTGGVLPFRPDRGVAHWFGVGAYLRPPSSARTDGVLFASECLAFAVPGPESEPGSRRGVPRDAGADWDFADVTDHYLREHGLTPAQAMIGVFQEWRRPGNPSRGGLVLWLRDLEPGAGWGLLDHRGRLKPGMDALADVLGPVALWLVDEGLGGVRVHVANDPAEPLTGRVVVRLLRHDGTVVEEGSRDVTVAPHGHLELDVEDLVGRFVDASYAYRFGSPAHDRVEAVLVAGGAERRARWDVDRAAPRLG